MRLLLFISTFFLSIVGWAQQGFFANAAYAWNSSASSGANIRFTRPPHFGLPPNAWHDAWDETAGSFSAGRAFWVEAGYRLSERAGFSVAARSVFAPKGHQYARHLDIFNALGTTSYTRKADKPLFLEPGIKLFLPISKWMEGYLRTGFLLPLRHTILASTNTPTASGGPFWQTESRLRTNFSLGGFGGAGLKANLADGFGLFIQGGFGLLSLQTRDETVLALSIGGADLVDELSKAERVVEFERGFDYLQTVHRPKELPGRRASYSVPFNYWSVELGIGWGMQ